jgi:hypothetical protein
MAEIGFGVRLATILGVVLLNAGAMAQPAVPSPQPKPRERTEPPSQPQVPPGPSNRGIIQPPAGLDPGIQAPAPEPNPNTTPVIPPPGTPGGNPAIRPR